MVVIVDENSGECATAMLEEQLQVSESNGFVLLYTVGGSMVELILLFSK